MTATAVRGGTGSVGRIVSVGTGRVSGVRCRRIQAVGRYNRDRRYAYWERYYSPNEM